MSNLPELPWEQIDNNTRRLKVHGGWLVITYEGAMTYMGPGDCNFGHEWRPAMAFVPDKMHQWKIDG